MLPRCEPRLQNSAVDHTADRREVARSALRLPQEEFRSQLPQKTGGANPIAVTTLIMCSVGAWSEIDWSISNQDQLEDNGELKASANKPGDRKLFEAWLNRWVRDSGINSQCDATRVYGLRCALVHTGAGSEALNRTGVKAWSITADDPSNHYRVCDEDVRRFHLEMPDFLAEVMLAADRSLNEQTSLLEQSREGLRLRNGSIAGPSAIGSRARLINNTGLSLCWFHAELPHSPLKIVRDELATAVRDLYDESVKKKLVFDY